MRRYWLFTGSNYYPGGGMRDFVKDFDLPQQAADHFNEKYSNEIYTWMHITDSLTGMTLVSYDGSEERNVPIEKFSESIKNETD